MKVIADFASVIGLGRGNTNEHRVKAVDTSICLAHERTDLALERNYLASERTLMGWIRTSLAIISFGFTIGKLGQILHEVEIKGLLGHFTHTVSVESIAYFLVVLGTVTLLAPRATLEPHARSLHLGFSPPAQHHVPFSAVACGCGWFRPHCLVVAL